MQLLLDRPSVQATLDVRIEERDGAPATINYFISLDRDYHGPEVRFFLTISGMARVPETYPNGDLNVRPNGCWFAAFLILENEETATCYKEKLGTGFGPTAPEFRVDTQVITGVLSGKDPRKMSATVLTYLDHGYAVSAGKRAYFTLPSIGTPYLPPDYRVRLKSDLGRGNWGFVPARLDLLIDYGDLAPTERFDSVVPEPEQAGAKSWIKLDASMVSARGALVDSALEDKAQRDTFLYGAYIGVAATILPILVEKSWSLWRRPERSDERAVRTQRDGNSNHPSEVPMPGTELLRRQLQRRVQRSQERGPSAPR